VLQKVTQRWAVGHCRTHQSGGPEYVVCEQIETLACGHKLTVYQQADACIATRRQCHQCDGLKLAPKKPASNVVEMPAQIAVNSSEEPSQNHADRH
jgi:hypothetical protein